MQTQDPTVSVLGAAFGSRSYVTTEKVNTLLNSVGRNDIAGKLSHMIESSVTYTNVVCIDVIILSFVQFNTRVVICKQKQGVNRLYFLTHTRVTKTQQIINWRASS